MLMHFMNLKDGIKIFSRVILKRSLNEKSEKEDGIQREEERNRFYPLHIFGFSGESEAGLDEGVEEGRLEPLSQEDCASNYSASSSRRVRNQPESLSLTVGDPFTEAEPPENSRKKRKLFRRKESVLSGSFRGRSNITTRQDRFQIFQTRSKRFHVSMNAKNKFKIYPSNFRRKYWTKYLELFIYVKKKLS